MLSHRSFHQEARVLNASLRSKSFQVFSAQETRQLSKAIKRRKQNVRRHARSLVMQNPGIQRLQTVIMWIVILTFAAPCAAAASIWLFQSTQLPEWLVIALVIGVVNTLVTTAVWVYVVRRSISSYVPDISDPLLERARLLASIINWMIDEAQSRPADDDGVFRLKQGTDLDLDEDDVNRLRRIIWAHLDLLAQDPSIGHGEPVQIEYPIYISDALRVLEHPYSSSKAGGSLLVVK